MTSTFAGTSIVLHDLIIHNMQLTIIISFHFVLVVIAFVLSFSLRYSKGRRKSQKIHQRCCQKGPEGRVCRPRKGDDPVKTSCHKAVRLQSPNELSAAQHEESAWWALECLNIGIFKVIVSQMLFTVSSCTLSVLFYTELCVKGMYVFFKYF